MRAILHVASSADCGNALGLWAVEWSNWNWHRGVSLQGPRTEIIQASNLEVDPSQLGGKSPVQWIFIWTFAGYSNVVGEGWTDDETDTADLD
jgi:hypothetical protein